MGMLSSAIPMCRMVNQWQQLHVFHSFATDTPKQACCCGPVLLRHKKQVVSAAISSLTCSADSIPVASASFVNGCLHLLHKFTLP